ncbi:MAG: prephenate dehydrogenase/arogenate dehydrogenase family protein [Anaerolineales bacterium]
MAIVGLGLMGGSLAYDLGGHCREIVGVSRSPATLRHARRCGLIDRAATFDAALDSDLLVLATPVRTILAQLRRMGQRKSEAGHGTVVLDLGSTKAEIVRLMESLPACYDPIGGHPMCGKEKSGIRNAEAGLYRGRVFILTPLARTSPRALQLVQEVIAVIGAHPLILSAERQDALVALTSHLPYLLACALMRTVLAGESDEVWRVAASGFRDTSRLAASDVKMMMDVLLTNRQAVIAALERYSLELDNLLSLLRTGDEPGLYAALAPARNQRAALFNHLS